MKDGQPEPGVWITFLDRIQPIFWRNLKIVSILLLVLYHSQKAAKACYLDLGNLQVSNLIAVLLLVDSSITIIDNQSTDL